MSDSKEKCEVVKSQALGKDFWYCRTHKKETFQSGCKPEYPYYQYPTTQEDDLAKEFERLLQEEGRARFSHRNAFRLRGPGYFEYTVVAGKMFDIARVPVGIIPPPSASFVSVTLGDWDITAYFPFILAPANTPTSMSNSMAALVKGIP